MKRVLRCLLLALAAIAAETPQELFEQGLVKERSEGNLKEAIQLYERAAETAGKNRALAAKALIEAAECYRKMGDGESRKLFERVVKEYPEQKDAVAAARLRLQDPNAAKAVLQRQMWAGPKVDVYGSISPNGRLLSFVDW
jgi:tetratricopeptide (TPR) repeat protein